MIIKRFAFWNPGTWQIPKLYWDAFSDEQRIHAICKQLGKVIAYADYLGVNVDDIAERLKAIEEGQITPIIVAAVEEWFEEHQEQIFGAITDLQEALPISEFDAENTVKDYIDDVDTKLGSGFDAENTVKDYIDGVDAKLGSGFDAENTVEDAIDDLQKQISSNIRDMAWNCRLRNIIDSNYDVNEAKSAQGMTIYSIGNMRFFAQAAIIGTDSAIIIYNLDTGVEVARAVGNYGHINDMCYSEGVLYALQESTSTLFRFTVTQTTITFAGSDVLTISVAAIQIANDSSWYTAKSLGQGNGIELTHYTNDFATVLDDYTIPFAGNAVIQGLSICKNIAFIALTVPNVLVYFNMESNEYYYYNVPQFIGHCMTDEVEGVYFDEEYNLYFNTNSIVDMQVMASLFTTNLVTNVEKEVDSSIIQNRYGSIICTIDAVNGDLVAPGEYGHTFKLAGDAINYAKSLGNFEIQLDFASDYPYPIVANGANITFMISTADLVVELHGIIARFCKINVTNVTRFVLNPTNISTLVASSIIYGGYLLNCDFDIGTGTWHALTSGSYDATHKRLYMVNGAVRVQETAYYRFYNCMVTAGSATVPSTSIFERTAIVAHAS